MYSSITAKRREIQDTSDVEARLLTITMQEAILLGPLSPPGDSDQKIFCALYLRVTLARR